MDGVFGVDDFVDIFYFVVGMDMVEMYLIYDVVLELDYYLVLIVIGYFVVWLGCMNLFYVSNQLVNGIDQCECGVDYVWGQIFYCFIGIFGCLLGGWSFWVGIKIFCVFVLELGYVIDFVVCDELLGILVGWGMDVIIGYYVDVV